MSGAAQESNLPTVGLPRPAGFEDGDALALGGRLQAVSDRLSDHGTWVIGAFFTAIGEQ